MSTTSTATLTARPRATTATPPAPMPSPARASVQPLVLGGERDGVVRVPAGLHGGAPAPLAVVLHGAGGSGRTALRPFQNLADELGIVMLAPDARGSTWDVIRGGYGPDVAFLDTALERVFETIAVDPARIALAGFSDGASYALSLGLANGDLFGDLIAFSPGFIAPAGQRGAPRIFVAHGVHDRVLPIDRCSRRLVPQLEAAGYRVHYVEFDGGHTVPSELARDALATLVRRRG